MGYKESLCVFKILPIMTFCCRIPDTVCFHYSENIRVFGNTFDNKIEPNKTVKEIFQLAVQLDLLRALGSMSAWEDAW